MAREVRKPSSGIRWQLWLGLALLGAVGVSTAVAALQVQRFVTTDPQFVLSRERADALTVEGAAHASLSRIRRVFEPDFGRSVFSAPIAERRRRLLAIDWVEDASVSRVWPDRLVVRVRERTPVAFVSTRTGVLLIDSYGVLLEPPPQARFTFPVLGGIREEQSEEERRGRVKSLLRLQAELGDLAKDISEVNASEPDNLRLVAQVDKRAVELILGDANYARRYRNFLSHYPEIRKRSPGAKVFDLRLDDRITATE